MTDTTPAPEPELNRAPRIITKAMRAAAAEALGFDPAIVKRIVIDAEARAIEVTSFVVVTPATAAAVNAPAYGELLTVRRYPFDAESRDLHHDHEDNA